MKKMMFILMIMTALLASNAFAAAPADITNPSFEDDTAGVCDAWTLAGAPTTGLVYHTGEPADAHSGDDFFEIKEDGGWAVIHTNLGEEVAVTTGTEAEMLVWAKSADGSDIPNGCALKFEWYAEQSTGWDDGTQEFAELDCDLTGDYQLFSLVAEVPAGMNYARATLVARNGAAAAYVDDVWIGVAGEYSGGGTPRSPVPASGSIQSVVNAPTYGYTPVTDLSWTNPALAEDSLLPDASQLGVEVKWGVGLIDPNFTPSSYSVPKLTGSAFETAALDTDLGETLPLADATKYYWQVIVTDFNGIDVPKASSVWSFETGDALPNIDTVASQYMWDGMDDGIDSDDTTVTFVVTTTYTDDGKSPIVDANHTTGDWLWVNGDNGVIEVSDIHTPDAPDGATGAQSGTVVATYRTVALGDVGAGRPLEETALPGYWNIGLEVTDSGSRTTSGATGYNYVGLDCGQAAAEGGDTAFAELVGTYDVNNDCVNNLVDFASLAAEWLDVSPKKE